MDLTVEQFVDGLLTKEALEKPSDSVKPEQLEFDFPPWYDEKEFNKARRFYWEHAYAFTTSMLLGLVAVFAVPSILRVLVGSQRSTSSFTAYRRYLSTLLHTQSWFENELKPGSRSWKSLYTVRSRHYRAGVASKLKGGGVVSQRDLALTQFGFVGFAMLKPDHFGIRAMQEGDWEAYNHFWRVQGYMIGIEDRYNICRKTFAETQQVCQLLLERVYTPSLENVPEHFEHMARVMLDGMWSVNPTVDVEALLYMTRYLADVPGYIYTEVDRQRFCNTLKEQLKGKSLDDGVDPRSLMCKPEVEGLPDIPRKLLYLRDFATVTGAPAYKRLTCTSRYKLALMNIIFNFYSTYIGRIYFNLNFLWSLVLMKYCPYLAFFRFGIKSSLVDIFVEDPTDNTQPKLNAEYYKKKAKTSIWSLFF